MSFIFCEVDYQIISSIHLAYTIPIDVPPMQCCTSRVKLSYYLSSTYVCNYPYKQNQIHKVNTWRLVFIIQVLEKTQSHIICMVSKSRRAFSLIHKSYLPRYRSSNHIIRTSPLVSQKDKTHESKSYNH